MKPTLLVDGDIVTYRAGFIVDQTLYEVFVEEDSATPSFSSTSMKMVKEWLSDNNVTTYDLSRTPYQKDPQEALFAARGMLTGLYDKFSPRDIKVYLDGGDNYRHEIATYAKYKGNRDSSRRPVYYQEIRNFLVEQWGAEIITGRETDDKLGMEQGEGTIICSIDKDLKQIPGTHYNWVKDELVVVDEHDSNRTLYHQVLTGDGTDNIIGIPGVGQKTADKYMDRVRPGSSSEEYWRQVVSVYKDLLPKNLPKGMKSVSGDTVEYPHWKTGETVHKTTEEFAEEIAGLVFIQRKGQERWQPPLKTQ